MDADVMKDLMGKHDPIDDLITVLLVVVTLFGAAIAWRQAEAHFVHDEATARAAEWSVLASSQQSRANQTTLLQSGRSWQVRRDRIGSQQAIAAALFGEAARPLLELEASQWRKRANIAESQSTLLAQEEAQELRKIKRRAAAALPDIDPSEGKRAPCEQPAGRVVDVVKREAFRMEGLRDGAEQTAAQAEDQFTNYAIALACVAVALFLFGYGLTKYGFRFRRYFILIGSALTIGAAVAAVIAYFDAPQRPTPVAAAAYADAQVALGHNEVGVALVDFGCATRLNPDFAAAFVGLSNAVAERGQPHDVAIVNDAVQSEKNLDKALKYGRRARHLDPDDPAALVQIAEPLFLQGVNGGDRRDLQRALALYLTVQGELPQDPVAAYNVGVTRLALGRQSWRESYRRAGLLTEGSSEQPEYIGGALTDLDGLQGKHLWRGVSTAVREAKDDVVSAGTFEPSPELDASGRGGQAELGGVRLSVMPEGALVSFRARNLHPRESVLFAAVYRKENDAWQEIRQLSGVAPMSAARRGRYQAKIDSDSLTSCVGSGTYKVELYVDGRLANGGAITEVTTRLPLLKRQTLPGMNVRICAPESWDRLGHHHHTTTGLVDGFERRGPGREGIVVADLSAAPRGGDRALAALALSRVAPLPDRARQIGPAIEGKPDEGLAAVTKRSYRYPGGTLMLKLVTTSIGRRLAIAVFGPPSFYAAYSQTSPSVAASLFSSVAPQDVSPFSSPESSGSG